MAIGIIIQARMSSSRLPGKSLMDVEGKPLIARVFDRCKNIEGISEIILATSSDKTDDELAVYALQNEYALFRGDLTNVQKRYYDAAMNFRIDTIIRVTGDNPFTSAFLIEQLIDAWKKSNVDYVRHVNCILGTGAELFSIDALERAIHHGPDEYDREHVTPPFYRRLDLFLIKELTSPPEYQYNDLRLTVDTTEDLQRARSIVRALGDNRYIEIPEIIGLFKEKVEEENGTT